MGEPLETIVKSIESVEESQALASIQNGGFLRDQMKLTKVQSSIVLFHLKDMHDWEGLRHGQLKTVS